MSAGCCWLLHYQKKKEKKVSFSCIVYSDRNSGSSVTRLWTGGSPHSHGPSPQQCVSRPGFCSQILKGLTALLEVFQCHRWCTAVAHWSFSNIDFCEQTAPDTRLLSWISLWPITLRISMQWSSPLGCRGHGRGTCPERCSPRVSPSPPVHWAWPRGLG